MMPRSRNPARISSTTASGVRPTVEAAGRPLLEVHVLADCDPESGRLAALSGDACRTGEEAELLAQATAFVAAGFLAPGGS